MYFSLCVFVCPCARDGGLARAGASTNGRRRRRRWGRRSAGETATVAEARRTESLSLSLLFRHRRARCGGNPGKKRGQPIKRRALCVSPALCAVASCMQDAMALYWLLTLLAVRVCFAHSAFLTSESALPCRLVAGYVYDIRWCRSLSAFFLNLPPTPPQQSVLQRGPNCQPELSRFTPPGHVSPSTLLLSIHAHPFSSPRPSPSALLRARSRPDRCIVVMSSTHRRMLPPGVGRTRARSAPVAWWTTSTCRC